MKKNFKWLTALAVVGTIIGIIIAYFCKKKSESSEFDEDDFEDDEDFDLDGDLKPVSERGYVPLNKSADLSAQKEDTKSGELEEKEELDSAKDEDVKEEDAPAVKETDSQADDEAASDKA